MSFGLKVWDENGAAGLQVSDKLTHHVRSLSVQVPFWYNESGYRSVYSTSVEYPGMVNDGKWFVHREKLTYAIQGVVRRDEEETVIIFLEQDQIRIDVSILWTVDSGSLYVTLGVLRSHV